MIAALIHPGSLRSLAFEVSVAPELRAAATGRLIVVMDRQPDREPRTQVGNAGMDGNPMLGKDAHKLAVGGKETLDGRCAFFPYPKLADLPAGEYSVQAVLLNDPNDHRASAPGNLYSVPIRTRLDPAKPTSMELRLSKAIPAFQMPPDTDRIKYLEIDSPLLTKFRGRPVKRRVAVVLPTDDAKNPDRKVPLVVSIGGYGTGLDAASNLLRLSDRSPVVFLQLDGTGPYGDTNQVNSDNNGPLGDSLVSEVILEVERRFRCGGKTGWRFTTGGSTGGWVSFALQVFYPDFFGGCWSYFPDPVDFRRFQLTDIYGDANHYVNRWGVERPSFRDVDGDIHYTVRNECAMENVLGTGDSYTMGGGQWGSWNATFGPRGADGRPKPLWDPKTGLIDRSVVEHWRKYDLRNVLESNWATLGPKLRGKIHLAVGDADEYFLNDAVVRLDAFLKKAEPPYEGRIRYGWRAPHGYRDIDSQAMLQEMAETAARG